MKKLFTISLLICSLHHVVAYEISITDSMLLKLPREMWFWQGVGVEQFAQCSDGRFLLLNVDTLYQFSEKGEYLNAVPNATIPDFAQIMSFWLENDTVFVSKYNKAPLIYVLNKELKLVRTFMNPILHHSFLQTRHCGKKWYMSGVGIKLEAGYIEMPATDHLFVLDSDNHTYKLLLGRTSKENEYFYGEMGYDICDPCYIDLSPNGNFLAVSRCIEPKIFIFDTRTDEIVRTFEQVPAHYKSLVPFVSYGGERFQDWFGAWTYSNVPFWLNDSTILISRVALGKSQHVDVYDIKRGLVSSLPTDKLFLTAQRGVLFFRSIYKDSSSSVMIYKGVLK